MMLRFVTQFLKTIASIAVCVGLYSGCTSSVFGEEANKPVLLLQSETK